MTDPAGLRAVLARWSCCRCVYARRPTDPCRCTPADLARAAAESPAATRRAERLLAARAAIQGGTD